MHLLTIIILLIIIIIEGECYWNEITFINESVLDIFQFPECLPFKRVFNLIKFPIDGNDCCDVIEDVDSCVVNDEVGVVSKLKESRLLFEFKRSEAFLTIGNMIDGIISIGSLELSILVSSISVFVFFCLWRDKNSEYFLTSWSELATRLITRLFFEIGWTELIVFSNNSSTAFFAWDSIDKL